MALKGDFLAQHRPRELIVDHYNRLRLRILNMSLKLLHHVLIQNDNSKQPATLFPQPWGEEGAVGQIGPQR
jgi:hypothetical protein